MRENLQVFPHVKMMIEKAVAREQEYSLPHIRHHLGKIRQATFLSAPLLPLTHFQGLSEKRICRLFVCVVGWKVICNQDQGHIKHPLALRGVSSTHCCSQSG